MTPAETRTQTAFGSHCIAAMAAAALLLILPMGCRRTDTMALEDARQVAVTMSRSNVAAPPRRIVDILDLLRQPGRFDPSVTERFKSELRSPEPETTEPDDLLSFYQRQGQVAFELGLATRAVEAFRKAQALADATGRPHPGLLFWRGKAEAGMGNIITGIRLMEKSQSVKRTVRNYQHLVRFYLRLGDFDTARRLAAEGTALARKAIEKRARKGRSWESIRDHEALMQATLLDAQGKHEEAEPFRRTHLAIKTEQVAKHPRGVIQARIALADNLGKQGRLVEAEKEIRQALRESIGLGGQNADFTFSAVLSLGKIILAQERIDEAAALAETAVDLLVRTGLEDHAAMVSKTHAFLVKALVEKGDFSRSVTVLDAMKRRLADTPQVLRAITGKPYIMLALIQTGRTDEALALIAPSHETLARRLGQNHRAVARRLGLRAMARYRRGEIESARKDFSVAVPVVLEELRRQNDRVNRCVLEAYMALLGETGSNQAAKASFRVAEALRGARLQRAIGAAASRTAGGDSAMGSLARQEQDLEQRRETIEALLLDILALPANETDPAAVARLENDLKIIKQARRSLLDVIADRFPRYADLRDPRPAVPSEIRHRLTAEEALISIYTGSDRSWVWAISPGRPTAFAMTPLGWDRTAQLVDRIRSALDLKALRLSQVPGFDLTATHRLYSDLLAPVRQGWQGANDLLFVVNGPLGRIPFAVLTTAPFTVNEKAEPLFAGYRDVPWLVRDVAISRLPSASALLSLRTDSRPSEARRPFIGFGDPFFNRNQAAEPHSADLPLDLAGRGRPLHVRGVRVVENGTSLDSGQGIGSGQLAMLNRLPDTAEELTRIALALKSDPKTDLFLGAKATEATVKAMDLSDRRVIAFATHALVSGDLDGLTQPALALCSPAVTGESDDGLLTLAEVLGLKLNADWVVLSACNTGAADGEGAEAVSGLGRAFFYAGARALLATMWSVETTSAARLTTALFGQMALRPDLSRSKALREAVLGLMDGTGLVDPATGEVAASYAHPFFWAPFILAGENGGGK